jgi:hypothetical protein
MAHQILRYFKFDHLPPKLQATSKPFAEVAEWVASSLPENAESATALRKLLEAKDCAVRAELARDG